MGDHHQLMQGTTYRKGSPSLTDSRSQGHSLGITASIVGLCGVALYWLPWVNLVCPAGLVILGTVGLQKASKGTVASRLPEVAALLLGCLLFLLGLFVIEVALSLSGVPGHSGQASP
jgi:hypothetical protein